MSVAVSRRPVENFQTEVPMPDWNLDSEDDPYANEVGFAPLVDENGNPLPGQPVDTLPPPGQPLPTQPQQPQTDSQLDQQWLDKVLPPGSGPPQRPQQQPQQRPQVIRPPNPSTRPAEPPQPVPNTPQQ